jgi:hypothetical protein
MSITTHLFATETPLDSLEERCEPRYPARAGVKVSLQAPPEIVTDDAVVSDISFRGLGILVERYIGPGTRVVVHMGTQRLETEVRHCTREEQRYRVGIVVYRASDRGASARTTRNWENILGCNRRQAHNN